MTLGVQGWVRGYVSKATFTPESGVKVTLLQRGEAGRAHRP